MGSAVVQGATFVAVLAMTAFLWRVFGKRFDTFAAEVNGRFDRSAIEVVQTVGSTGSPRT